VGLDAGRVQGLAGNGGIPRRAMADAAELGHRFRLYCSNYGSLKGEGTMMREIWACALSGGTPAMVHDEYFDLFVVGQKDSGEITLVPAVLWHRH